MLLIFLYQNVIDISYILINEQILILSYQMMFSKYLHLQLLYLTQNLFLPINFYHLYLQILKSLFYHPQLLIYYECTIFQLLAFSLTKVHDFLNYKF